MWFETAVLVLMVACALLGVVFILLAPVSLVLARWRNGYMRPGEFFTLMAVGILLLFVAVTLR